MQELVVPPEMYPKTLNTQAFMWFPYVETSHEYNMGKGNEEGREREGGCEEGYYTETAFSGSETVEKIKAGHF